MDSSGMRKRSSTEINSGSTTSATSRSRERSSVSFSHSVVCRPFLSRQNYSISERHATWYTRKELQQNRQEEEATSRGGYSWARPRRPNVMPYVRKGPPPPIPRRTPSPSSQDDSLFRTSRYAKYGSGATATRPVLAPTHSRSSTTSSPPLRCSVLSRTSYYTTAHTGIAHTGIDDDPSLALFPKSIQKTRILRPIDKLFTKYLHQ